MNKNVTNEQCFSSCNVYASYRLVESLLGIESESTLWKREEALNLFWKRVLGSCHRQRDSARSPIAELVPGTGISRPLLSKSFQPFDPATPRSPILWDYEYHPLVS